MGGMKGTHSMKTTMEIWEYINRMLNETGYASLSEDHQAICDASDNGTLTIIE